MIEGDIRREKIIEIMSNQKEPVSGSDLAKKFGVSRQVIVQDIALLRATNKNILSTNKGYFLYNPGKGPQKPKRSFCVQCWCVPVWHYMFCRSSPALHW